MPELPEAEANRRRIEAGRLRRTIEAVCLGPDTRHVDLPDEGARARLVGHQFAEARRHGKVIFAGSNSGPWIAVHLGMTGALRPIEAGDGLPDHARIVVAFEGSRRVGGGRGAVKSALMSQKKLAGIGNLWSDEMLFQTGTPPGCGGARSAAGADRGALRDHAAGARRRRGDGHGL